MVNLYVRDVEGLAAFYREAFGFAETFHTPREGAPVHVELRLGAFVLGFASIEAAKAMHGLPLASEPIGRRAARSRCGPRMSTRPPPPSWPAARLHRHTVRRLAGRPGGKPHPARDEAAGRLSRVRPARRLLLVPGGPC
ncbi:VOC family protein [Inquilinus limosus]|uniref:VOC family protein n=1 Tax=Inquilinus limosus TaxID=171674 RepID=UPI003F5CCD85